MFISNHAALQVWMNSKEQLFLLAEAEKLATKAERKMKGPRERSDAQIVADIFGDFHLGATQISYLKACWWHGELLDALYPDVPAIPC